MNDRANPYVARRIISLDLSTSNDVLRLPDVTGCVLAGGALIGSGPGAVARQTMLREVVALVVGADSHVRHILLVGHTTWQPSTRIVRYNRLWKSIAKRSPLPGGMRSSEYMIESHRGVKYFGYIELDHVDAVLTASLYDVEPACNLIALYDSKTEILDNLAQQGWDTPVFTPPLPILKMLCRNDAALYRSVGTFDDREQGAALISKEERIRRVFG